MKRRILWMLPVVGAAAFAATGSAEPPSGPTLTPVAAANVKSPGYAPPNVLSPELTETPVAQGSTPVENPSGIVTYYGYESDTVNAQGQAVMVPAPGLTESQKTEPDKNTYLVFKDGLKGADSSYDYGNAFLFQGHEVGAKVGGATQGSITRINLDADPKHRVTVLATQDSQGHPIAGIDGSTWDPWAEKLLFTTENSSAPTYQATPGYPSTVDDIAGSLGRGGYEGIQNDSAGNVWIVEDIGGPLKSGASFAKRPNSFVYRFVPTNPSDLTHGKLQALQVLNSTGQPITFESQAGLHAADEVAVHTYGQTFKTRWVTVHDTAVDGTTSFNANDAAKAAHATPFKRPENGQFRPNTKFTEFYFDETGDTNAGGEENSDAGGWGSILKLTQSSPSADTGTLSLFAGLNEATAGIDNVAFLSHDLITFVQDAGDTLHTQANALDSGWVWNVTADYSSSSNQPFRWLAEGRDPSAALDAANGGFGKNEGDNEITGIHVSDGDPGKNGILGAKDPELNNTSWRIFWTQQHGDNSTFEVQLKNKG